MPPNHYDIIVIGLGAMGAAACHHLAHRNGVRVLGLEQFSIVHGLGSSLGHTRMIRLAYYEHPDYVPLLRRAYQLWDQLEAESGEKILYRTGGVYMGSPTPPSAAPISPINTPISPSPTTSPPSTSPRPAWSSAKKPSPTSRASPSN